MLFTSISKEWYLENYNKLKEIILSYDPDYETSSTPLTKNKVKSVMDESIQFMDLKDDGGTSSGYHTTELLYYKVLLLYRKMKKSPIGYWKS